MHQPVAKHGIEEAILLPLSDAYYAINNAAGYLELAGLACGRIKGAIRHGHRHSQWMM
jgi:hypothetical protein